MSDTTSTTVIELLGRPYQIKCEPADLAKLQKAAQYLNSSVRNMPGGNKMLSPEKLAVMAALNLASQILQLEEQMTEHREFLNQRLDSLQNKLEFALQPLTESCEPA